MNTPTTPRGTHDIHGDDARLREHVLACARRVFDRAGLDRLYTPTFEDTTLFARGVGEQTDVVNKEMYTFEDRGGRSITLRPEGTAPAVRAFINHGMHRLPQPVGLWYAGPYFRYEAPQKGRQREFSQLGVEMFGSDHAAVDAEVIGLLAALLDEVGIGDWRLAINTLGSADDRNAYGEMVRERLAPHAAELGEDDRTRLTTNPLRLLDSKHPVTRELVADLPSIIDHVGAEARTRFEHVAELLGAAGIDATVDPTLVRGLDYYTHTAFEVTSPSLGAQDALAGGGRYDDLVAHLGGPATPAVGFGIGIERIELAMQAAGIQAGQPWNADVYICVLDEAHRATMYALEARLRAAGHRVRSELAGRSLKGQLKQASRLGAHVAVIADGEGLRLRRMQGRDEQPTTAESIESDLTTILKEHEQ